VPSKGKGKGKGEVKILILQSHTSRLSERRGGGDEDPRLKPGTGTEKGGGEGKKNMSKSGVSSFGSLTCSNRKIEKVRRYRSPLPYEIRRKGGEEEGGKASLFFCRKGEVWEGGGRYKKEKKVQEC